MIQTEHIAIAEACAVITGHSFRQKPTHTAAGNVCVIQPKDVLPDGSLLTEELPRVKHQPRKLLCAGDVLLINRGRFTAAVFDGTMDTPCVATSAFMILTPRDSSRLLPDFLALYLNSREGQAHFKRITDSSTVPFINRTNLGSITIATPPTETQRKLVALEKTRQRYCQLTARKSELIGNLINSQLI